MKTILVIDDDIEIRDALRELFEIEGYGVLTAGDGAEALELLSRVHVPDVILLDQNMPNLNGAEFLARLRFDERCCNVPVLMMSAQRPRITDPKVRGFVSKPFQIPALLEAVRGLGVPA